MVQEQFVELRLGVFAVGVEDRFGVGAAVDGVDGCVAFFADDRDVRRQVFGARAALDSRGSHVSSVAPCPGECGRDAHTTFRGRQPPDHQPGLADRGALGRVTVGRHRRLSCQVSAKGVPMACQKRSRRRGWGIVVAVPSNPPATTSQASTVAPGVARSRSLRGRERATPIRLVSGRDVMASVGAPHQNLALIAGAQRGRISWAQLAQAGFTRRMIRTAVANGRLHHLRPGVYAVGHRGEPELGRETVSLLAVGPPAVLVGITALELYKAIPADSRHPVHIALGDGRTARSRPGIKVHRYSRLLPSQIRIREGLPVTSAERALLDAAPLLTPRQLERAFDEAIATRATSRTKVLNLLSVTSGRAGQASPRGPCRSAPPPQPHAIAARGTRAGADPRRRPPDSGDPVPAARLQRRLLLAGGRRRVRS